MYPTLQNVLRPRWPRSNKLKAPIRKVGAFVLRVRSAPPCDKELKELKELKDINEGAFINLFKLFRIFNLVTLLFISAPFPTFQPFSPFYLALRSAYCIFAPD